MDKDTVLQAALDYAGRGWPVVPLYAPTPDGGCTCAKGKQCGSPGKHPRIKAWQKLCSTHADQVERWWRQWPDANVGVAFGEASGIIDVECDSPEAEKDLLTLLGEDAPVVPTFKGARGKHRLFRYRQDLPPGAVVKIGKIEVRLGNDAKGAQSVFPPSLHASGVRYEWLVGPDEADPGELPKGVLAKLWNLAGEERIAPEKPPSARRKLYEQPTILETVDGRDNTLYAEACAMWGEQHGLHGPPCFDSPDSQTTVYGRLWAQNKARCVPPMDDADVLRMCESARNYIKQQRSAEIQEKGPSLAVFGLEYRDDEWWPGAWRVETVNSDPPVMRLHAPFLPPKKPIEFLADDYNSPTKVHVAVLAATGEVCLDDGVRPWKTIWKGYYDRKEKKGCRGLFAKLLDAATKIEAPEEVKREHVLAEFVWRWLEKAPVLPDEEKPMGNRKAFRRADGSLWFSFEALRQQADFERADQITRNELSKLVRAAGAEDRTVGLANGERKRFMCLDEKAQARLRDYTLSAHAGGKKAPTEKPKGVAAH